MIKAYRGLIGTNKYWEGGMRRR